MSFVEIRVPSCDFVWLTLNRWRYLEAGVSKIMTNLQDGIDMTTVSLPAYGYELKLICMGA